MITAIDKHSALVLIDLQKGILRAPTAHPVENVIQQAALLVEAFRKAGLPIVPVTVMPGGSWLQTRKDQQRPTTPLPADFADIVEEIKTQAGDIFITKHHFNAFYNTALHSELQKRGITNIVLGGVSTSVGVEGTARAASELGYNISFAIDAMTDSNADGHEHSVSRIFPRLGEAGSTADIIARLNSRA